ILIVASHYKSKYELYAHINIARSIDINENTIINIINGIKSLDLSESENIIYDVTSSLLSCEILSDELYTLLLHNFGKDGVNEIFHLIGVYSLISILLNGYNVAVP